MSGSDPDVNRLVGIILAGSWLCLMTLLVQRDVIPFWTAQDPPRPHSWSGEYQTAIGNDADYRVGTSWVVATSTPSGMRIHSATVLDLGGLSSFLPKHTQLLVRSELSYQPDDTLDAFLFSIDGAGVPITVRAERFGRDYACEVKLGATRRLIPLDGRLSECLGESFRPFTHLEDLYVGQTWRIRLLDLLSVAKGDGAEFNTRLVTVTGTETIEHRGQQVGCFRIESEGTVAWADDSGRVLRQEVSIPLLGRLVLTEEPVDHEARTKIFAAEPELAE